MKDPIRFPQPKRHWRNDRWQAAWRGLKTRVGEAVMVCVGPAEWVPCFEQNGKVVLTGDDLANELRDFALGEAR